jgi:hypothetical protein
VPPLDQNSLWCPLEPRRTSGIGTESTEHERGPINRYFAGSILQGEYGLKVLITYFFHSIFQFLRQFWHKITTQKVGMENFREQPTWRRLK